MCDLSKWKSPGYCRGRNKMKIVPRTKWELPTPGSKPYWDAVCSEIENNMEHVRDPFSYFLSKPSDLMNDRSNVSPDFHVEISKPTDDSPIEPIVTVSPPTPLRATPHETVTDKMRSFSDNDSFGIDRRENEFSTGWNSERRVAPVVSSMQPEVSRCINEFLKTGKIHRKDSCPFHKNMPPVQFFDDNLKNVLPKNKPKLHSQKTTTHGMPVDRTEFSKLHSKENCPLRSRATTSIHEQKTSKFYKRPETAGSRKPCSRTNLESFLESSEPSKIASLFNHKYSSGSTRIEENRPKSKLVKDHLKSLLDIPKLNKVANDENLFSHDDKVACKRVTFDDSKDHEKQSELERKSKTDDTSVKDRNISNGREPKVPKLGTVSLHPSFNKVVSTESLDETRGSQEENRSSESSKSTSVVRRYLPEISDESLTTRGSGNGCDQRNSDKNLVVPEMLNETTKDYLRVPKLGLISSYPSFGKLSHVDSLDKGDDRKSTIDDRSSSGKRDFSKVPKLGKISSHPSFNNLLSDSYEEKESIPSITTSQECLIGERASESDHKSFDDESTKNKSKSDLTKSMFNEKSNTMAKTTPTISGMDDIASESKTARNTDEDGNSVENRRDPKYSIRFAYRALKLLTPNKNLDFFPKSHDPSLKSFSSDSSSTGSSTTDSSAIDAAYKMITHEDILKDRRATGSSSTSYGSVTYRLRKNAAEHLGPGYALPGSTFLPRTSSATIPSSTRSTSGPTPRFTSPILKTPSAPVLNKIPKMSVFPRRNRDRCFACLHKPFEMPKPEVKREMPLTILYAISKEPIPEVTESDSSSVSLPVFRKLDDVDFESDHEQNERTEPSRDSIGSPIGESSEMIFSRNLHPDVPGPTKPSLRVSQESLIPKTVSNFETVNQNLSPKVSRMSVSNSKSLSASSDRSPSGHSSESDDTEIPIDQNMQTSKYFVPCHAPLNLRPSLEALKALRSKKPVSLYSRDVCVTKSVDDSDSGDTCDETSRRKDDPKKQSTFSQKQPSRKLDSSDEDTSTKSQTKLPGSSVKKQLSTTDRQTINGRSALDSSTTDQRSVDDRNDVGQTIDAIADQQLSSSTKDESSVDQQKIVVSADTTGKNDLVKRISKTLSRKSLFTGDSERKKLLKRLKSVPEKLSTLTSFHDSKGVLKSLKEDPVGISSSVSATDDIGGKTLIQRQSTLNLEQLQSGDCNRTLDQQTLGERPVKLPPMKSSLSRHRLNVENLPLNSLEKSADYQKFDPNDSVSQSGDAQSVGIKSKSRRLLKLKSVQSFSDRSSSKFANTSRRPAGSDSQTRSDEDSEKMLKDCIEMHDTPLEMLEALSNKFMETKLLNRDDLDDPEVAKSAKIAKNLVKLLVESKEYLNPDIYSSSKKFSSKQPPLCNTRQLRRILPLETYNLVAPVLGMPKWYVKRFFTPRSSSASRNKSPRPSCLSNRGKSVDTLVDLVVHPPTVKSDPEDEDDFEYPTKSPYALFIDKPRRKAVTWRPLTDEDLLGYDPEATLNMRATRVTNKICEDFCQWLRSLGGTDEGIDEEVLRDMFQIDFTAEACRTMQVLIKEMPMVPTVVALTRNSPGAGELAITRRHLVRDAKAERRPKNVSAFGTDLPKEMRFIPPKNRTEERWLQCENVPRDLETMNTVWRGITRLDSVKGFLAWLRGHPHVKPPEALRDALASKPVTRQSLDEEGFAHLELETDQIQSLKVGDNDPDANE